MGLTRLAITRPLAILMLILGIVLMGAVSYTRLKVDRLPPITIPFLSVNIGYPGASPEDVESLILEPLEDALAGVPGALSLSSTAREGSGSVNIQLTENTNLDQSLTEVQRRLAAIAPQLPKDANDPRISKFDPNASPVMNLALTGGDQQQLYELANDVILPKLLSIPGVADVDLSGGLQREVQIRVDPVKLVGHGVTVDQITSALQRENISSPAGRLDQGTTSLSVRSIGLFQKPEELGNLIIGTARNGSPIYLRNIATVVDTNRERTRFLRYDGEDAVGLSITKQSDANTIQVAEAVRAALGPLTLALPVGSKLLVVNDSSRFVRRSLDAVQFDLGLAAFLTATVLLLFLHTLRNTVIVLLSIPTSLIATTLVMYLFGFSLNVMTLMALAMTIGILVDDSIVVLENIHRHLHRGEEPKQAAISGRSEIGLAAMAITFTDIVVYLPVAFMQGNVGQLFQQYGITVATATMFSLLVSFTLTPMLASRWLKQREEESTNPLGRLWGGVAQRWERGFDALSDGYARTLGRVLRVRLAVVGLAVIAVGFSVWLPLTNKIGVEYAPQEDDGQFTAQLTLPTGSSLASLDEAARMLEAKVLKIPEVESVYTSVGGGQGGFVGGNASLTIVVGEKSHRKRSIEAIMAEVRGFARQIPEATVRTSVQNPLPGGRSFIGINLLGDDLATLGGLSEQVIKVAQDTPGIASATSSFQAQQAEVRFSVDRERASAAGISASQAASALRTMLQGTVVSQLRADGVPAVDIRVMGDGSTNLTPAALSGVPVGTGRNGSVVTLGQVSRLQNARSPVQIQRLDRKRTVSLNASVEGRPVGDAARDLRANLATVPMPPGYRWDIRGTVQQLDQAIAGLTAALALSVLLIYMLLVALYESWLYPLSIMFSLPVALLGAFVGLMATGNTINIFSIIGVIALMGLVAKNAILLVDFTNTLRARGLARNEALMEAGRARLRPIVMTSTTVVVAMLPLAFKLESGAESRAPMAVVIIGGVISSTLLTLGLVPVMYTILDDVQHRLRIPSTFRWPWHRAPALEPIPVPAGAGPAAGPITLSTTLEASNAPDAGHRS